MNLRGPEATARAMHSEPLFSSERQGWKDLSVCLWSAEVEDVELPPMAEVMLVLHTGGPVEFCRSGEADARSRPGQMAVFAPERATHIRARGKLSGISLHLSLDRLERITRDPAARAASKRLVSRIGFADPFLASITNVLAAEIQSPTELGSLYADAVADTLGLHLLRHAPATKGSAEDGGERAFRIACDRLEASLEEGISLDDLAREAGISRYQLRRLFQSRLGTAPHRYLTQRRIDRAKTLLGSTDLPLVEIASACGFSSQAHLCERFRAETGATPGAFRRRVQR